MMKVWPFGVALRREAPNRLMPSTIETTPGYPDGSWPPRSGMTHEENLTDLRRHAADFTRGVGFTFTVLDPGDNDVIGCVYLYPSASEDWDVTVQSWVRAARSGLDVPLADAVARWLATDWPWERVDRCGSLSRDGTLKPRVARFRTSDSAPLTACCARRCRDQPSCSFRGAGTARVQPPDQRAGVWTCDERALEAAADATLGNVDVLRESLHVDAASVLHKLGRQEDARQQLEAARQAEQTLPENGYRRAPPRRRPSGGTDSPTARRRTTVHARLYRKREHQVRRSPEFPGARSP